MQNSKNKSLERFKVIDGSFLKIIAVITMLIDHISMFLLVYMPQSEIVIFKVLNKEYTLYYLMRLIGRSAFPIYAFLITEGYIHTSNRFKYGRNLLIFAFVSELPWNYVHTLSFRFSEQNVFFTLFLGYLGVCLYEKFSENQLLRVFSVLGIFLLTFVVRADYGAKGYALIFLFYALRQSNLLKIVCGPLVLGEGIKPLPAFIPISMYNGKRGFIKAKPLKYAFYVFYPLHLLIIGIIKKKYFS